MERLPRFGEPGWTASRVAALALVGACGLVASTTPEVTYAAPNTDISAGQQAEQLTQALQHGETVRGVRIRPYAELLQPFQDPNKPVAVVAPIDLGESYAYAESSYDNHGDIEVLPVAKTDWVRPSFPQERAQKPVDAVATVTLKADCMEYSSSLSDGHTETVRSCDAVVTEADMDGLDGTIVASAVFTGK